MAKVKELHSEMARARHNDGISVIFDQKSPVSSRSRSRSGSSRSSSSRSSDPERHRGRRSHRGRYRSKSSSTSPSRSRSSSHARSRSHPRCHRPSSRCRCDGHYRSGRGRYRRSPQRSHKASSHSLSRSPSSDRYSQRYRHYRSRSRSSSRLNRHRRNERRFRDRPSRSPSKTHRSRSQSRTSGRSASLSVDDKKEFNVAKANAMKLLGTEKLDLPESVKPILSEEPEVTAASPQPETWVRQDPEKTPSQSSEEELDDLTIPRISPKRKIISFSINNSVVKPAVVAPSSAKVTARVDIYESRKPYGHWVPVKSGQRAKTHKHTHAMSH